MTSGFPLTFEKGEAKGSNTVSEITSYSTHQSCDYRLRRSYEPSLLHKFEHRLLVQTIPCPCQKIGKTLIESYTKAAVFLDAAHRTRLTSSPWRVRLQHLLFTSTTVEVMAAERYFVTWIALLGLCISWPCLKGLVDMRNSLDVTRLII